MTVSHSRSVGDESGVQLNPSRDRSEMPTQVISDQVFGVPMRTKRGRIDRTFLVDRSNIRAKLGTPDPVRVSRLNEAFVHVQEALNKGAYQAVVGRLVSSAAKIKWLVCTYTPATAQPQAAEAFTFSVSDGEPEGEYLFALKHNECFNDGIKTAIHCPDVRVAGEYQSSSVVTIKLMDKDNVDLYSFTASLNAESKDEFGQGNWLPDVVTNKAGDNVEALATVDGVISAQSACYGLDGNGRAKWVTSDVLECFSEGGTAYTHEDYVNVRNRLHYTPHNYNYISSGGSRAVALLGQLAQLSFDTNTQFRFDVPGDLKPEEAVAFMEQINATGQPEAHLLHAYWSPIRSADPAGINAANYFGVATLNIAYACARNAQKNTKGFAPKNFPIAGKAFPLNRQGMVQTYTPSAPELSMLAKAKINVVCFEEFDTGGLFVFRDSVTCAPVNNSLKKLIAVADMACHTDDAVTRFAKAALQKPMKTSVKDMGDFLKEYFRGAQDSDWIVPAADPDMDGAAAKYYVGPSEARPYEEMVVSYSVRYDGTNRVTTVTQTFVR